MNDEKTHFGFEQVGEREKAARVAGVFSSVAGRYDLMNDLMSLGVHRLWKRMLVELCAVRPGHAVLDLAGGSGDVTRLLARRVGPLGRVVLADVNPQMLELGRRRLVDANAASRTDFLLADAERLPFPDRSFDRVCIAFGLRNVTRKARALEAIYRVLRPGGALLVLEFSRLRVSALRPAYRVYLDRVLPWLGARVAGDADSYRYLAESIQVHPDQEALLAMLEAAGFEACRVHNLSGGIAAVHLGRKL